MRGKQTGWCVCVFLLFLVVVVGSLHLLPWRMDRALQHSNTATLCSGAMLTTAKQKTGDDEGGYYLHRINLIKQMDKNEQLHR